MNSLGIVPRTTVVLEPGRTPITVEAIATAVFGAVVGMLAAVAPSVRATRLNILGAINRA